MLVSLFLACAPTPMLPEPTRLDWLSQHSHPLRTLDLAGDLSDLEAAWADIGTPSVVILGEATHGDGAAITARGRLIRFLHEVHDYDALIMESDFYGCHRAGQQLVAGTLSGPAAFDDCAFGMWGRATQARDLTAWLEKTAHTPAPMMLAGMDPQLHARHTRHHLLDELDALSASLSAETATSFAAVRPLLEKLIRNAFVRDAQQQATDHRGTMMDHLPRVRPPEPERAEFFAHMAVLHHATADPFWQQTLASLTDQARALWSDDPARQLGDIRDARMAANVLWHLENGPTGTDGTTRVIVWAATLHGARNTDLLAYPRSERALRRRARSSRGMLLMGTVLKAALGSEVYTLAITAAGGSAGQLPGGWHRESLAPLRSDSIEGMVAAAGQTTDQPGVLLNLRDPPPGGEFLASPDLYARPMGYTFKRGPWPEVVDGFLIIGEMTPILGDWQTDPPREPGSERTHP